ncbi:MAG: hypothetical protein CNLJKLNK_01301 [Holosporales bacterium]
MLQKKSALLLSLFFFSFGYGAQKESLHTSHIKDILLENQVVHGESAQVFLENFIRQDYRRDLVTQFVKACPKIRRLSDFLGRTPSTIWKLKNPEYYGELKPTANILWNWLQTNGINGIILNLNLNDEDIAKMKSSIETTDTSECGLSSCSTGASGDAVLDEILLYTIDTLAAIASRKQDGNIYTVIPPLGKESIDENNLSQIRNRFKIILENAFSFFPDVEAKQIQQYIEALDAKFQHDQEEKFGISVYEKLSPIISKYEKYLINPVLFNITGGFEEIIATTPDKAFVPSLNIFITQDFKTIVTFIKEMELIITDDQQSKLENVKKQLIIFSKKWNESAIESYLSTADEKLKERAQEFMQTIRDIIKGIEK